MANKTYQDALAQGAIPQPVTLMDTSGNAYATGSGGSDPDKNLTQKGLTFVSITTPSVGATSLTFSSAPLTLQAGQEVYLTGGSSTPETVIVASSFVPGVGVVNVPLQGAVTQANHSSAGYDTNSPTGPAAAGFLAYGISPNAPVLYDPVSGLYYIQQAATADMISAQNVPMQAIGLWNSSNSTVDRLRDAGSLGDQYTNGLIGTAQFLFNGGSFDRERTPTSFKTIAAVSVTQGTPEAVWTPSSGKKFHLMGFLVSSSVNCSIIFLDGSTEMFRIPVLAGAPIDSPANFGNGYASSSASNALNINVTSTGTVSGFVFGTEEY